jgi:TRAP-type mannitol/chloroaromatic compound transport system substrate-binding protein
MERRKFLKAAALGTAGAGVLSACGGSGAPGGLADADGVFAGPEITWRLASSYPRGLDILYGTAEHFAARVAQLTGDRFQIRSYPAGELVPGLAVMDAIQQGTVQAGHTASYYYEGKHPALVFDAGIPFGFTPDQQNAWLYHGNGLALLREFFSDFGIIQFPCGNTGMQWGGWFRNPVESVSDLRGLRMRIPGLGGKVMDRLGMSVQVLAGGEIYPALERGAIDATEWVGPYDDEKLGFQNIAQYYYYPGWQEPGPTTTLMVSLRHFNDLPEGYRFAIEVAAAEQNQEMLNRFGAANPAALERLVAGGVELRRYSDEILQAAFRESNSLLEEMSAQNPDVRRVYDDWKQFRKLAFQYSGRLDESYSSFAFRQSV